MRLGLPCPFGFDLFSLLQAQTRPDTFAASQQGCCLFAGASLSRSAIGRRGTPQSMQTLNQEVNQVKAPSVVGQCLKKPGRVTGLELTPSPGDQGPRFHHGI